MEIYSKSALQENGAQFGHYKKSLHPRMIPNVFRSVKNVSIIDIESIYRSSSVAYQQIKELAAAGKKILFLCTEKHFSQVAKESAIEANCFYLTNKWVPGFFTNFRTSAFLQIKRLNNLKRIFSSEDSQFRGNKKNSLIEARKFRKLTKTYEGVANLDSLPDCIFIMGINSEMVAVKEARMLGIPIISVCDTNTNPNLIDYCIIGNDDGIRSSALFIRMVSDAIKEGKGIELKKQPLEEIQSDQQSSFESSPQSTADGDRIIEF